jgi:hypothetical protein
LLGENLDPAALVIILIAYLATLFGISYLLIKQLGGSEKSKVEFQSRIPPAMNPSDTNQLEEPKQNPASVVENTTRTLDKVRIEHK